MNIYSCVKLRVNYREENQKREGLVAKKEAIAGLMAVSY